MAEDAHSRLQLYPLLAPFLLALALPNRLSSMAVDASRGGDPLSHLLPPLVARPLERHRCSSFPLRTATIASPFRGAVSCRSGRWPVWESHSPWPCRPDGRRRLRPKRPIAF